MTGILRLESLTKGSTLKQGDETPLKYRLFDADGDKLSIAGKSAVARLMYPDFIRVGYESEELTVSPDNTVTFSIDKVIKPILYYVEITVDDKYIFPSRADESKINIDKSSKGSDVAIIEIIGKDILIRDVREQVETEIKPVVDDMIIANQKVLENEKIVQDVNSLAQQLENRQNQVEQFNNQVITEMTDKDVISAPEIIEARDGFDTLGQRLDETTSSLEQAQDDLRGRGVNAKSLGFKLDGIEDEGEALNTALIEHRHIYIPDGSIIGTSVPIRLRRTVSLIGGTNSYSQPRTPVIKWLGLEDRKQSAVIIGNNLVGAEPDIDGSGVVFKNFVIDGDLKVGIGIYGTYLTNECDIENVQVTGTLEYAGYFARAWYASFKNLLAKNNQMNGWAFGMPLEYSDGEVINWTTLNPLEMNNCYLEKIRSARSGQYYSVDNPSTWTPHNASTRRKGYGIGAGIGNSFHLRDFISEGSGGANLYVLTGSQPQKTLQKGYLESANLNSGLSSTSDMANIIIEHTSEQGGSYEIKDIYMALSSGGIFHVGAKRQVWLKNVHQPAFLKSLDGLSDIDLFSIVLKENVYYMAGYNNTDERLGECVLYNKYSPRSFTPMALPVDNRRLMVQFKLASGSGQPGSDLWGSENQNGTFVGEYSYPANLSTTEWKTARVLSGGSVRIVKRGADSEVNSEVIIRVLAMPQTFF